MRFSQRIGDSIEDDLFLLTKNRSIFRIFYVEIFSQLSW